MTAADRTEWLSRTTEDPVDPERQIIDAHHHLWEEGQGLGGMPEYVVKDLLRDTGAGHNVRASVFIECGTRYRQDGLEQLRPVGETEFAAAQARQSTGSATQIAAIVAYADMTLGDAVEEVLQAHEDAGQGFFRGIRHGTAADPGIHLRADAPPLGLLASASFLRGLARLAGRGHSFDAFVFHPQLPEVAEAARAVPGGTFIVDHLGVPIHLGPYTDNDQIRSVWRQGMGQLAACPNVVVKLGGIGMDSLFGTNWSSQDRPPGSDQVIERWGDDIRWCIDTFGPGRCMFESNFPVDRRAIGYTVVWNAFQKVASSYSDEEQDALFAGTAARVYRIERGEETPAR